MSQRIQRKRTKGWKMPPNTVYVGRPTQWGNPFPIDKAHGGAVTAVKLFRQYVVDRLANGVGYPLAALRGKDLACWCPIGTYCHADVLLEIANAAACTETEGKL